MTEEVFEEFNGIPVFYRKEGSVWYIYMINTETLKYEKLKSKAFKDPSVASAYVRLSHELNGCMT